MSLLHDQNYLKNDQYRQGDHLDARIQLHKRFSTNPSVYFEWMLDQLKTDKGAKVLDVGCGTGELWAANLRRLPPGVQAILMDLSAGMAVSARKNLPVQVFNFGCADVQSLPFEEHRFDRVVANYMLYHVPDISLAVRELRRVLKPGGILCAATNGNQHMLELFQLMRQFSVTISTQADFTSRYGLENASHILGEHFAHVQIVPFTDSLFVTDASALLNYIHSMVGYWQVDPYADAAIKQFVEEEIRSKGGFTIHKASGAVLAW